jgi:hypothetical protein
MLSAAKTASNAIVNRESRSRSRNFTVCGTNIQFGLTGGCGAARFGWVSWQFTFGQVAERGMRSEMSARLCG